MTPFPVKPRDCEICSKSFIPFKSTQRVCGLTCAKKVGKQLRTKAKVTMKVRKDASKDRRSLLKEVQTECNKYIRARDYDKPCISCGKPPPDMSQLHAGRDAGHYRSVGAAKHLRFHEDNIHAQCVACNQHKAGNAVDYRIGLVERIGIERVEALETDSTVKKWQHDELLALRDDFINRRKALEKERA